MTDAQSLLQRYVEHGSESAFRELVTRYIDFVYSVALRRVGGNVHLAQDVAQTVFTDLVRKARKLPPDVMLGGWLHRHTCFVSSTAVRHERRRQARERNAVEMNALHAPADADWQQLVPILDEAVDQLGADDRKAIILRFFEGLDLREVGAAFGATDDAAQKRVSRAVDKLRELLTQRGVTLTVTALATALAGRAVTAAPVGLATTVSGGALLAGASSAGLAAVVLKLLAPIPVKLALGAIAVATLATPILLHSHNTPLAGRPDAKNGSYPPAQIVDATIPPSLPTASTNPSPTDASASSTESNMLRLTLLAADTGQPVPNALIDYQGHEGSRFTRKSLYATHTGICDVAFPRATTTKLELTTRIDGFADTRLHWETDHGETIPTNYVLRLVRPVPIGGRVLDARGRPVAGAKVGFNNDNDPTVAVQTEDHEFFWIEVTTDADGRWNINRIAPEMIRRLHGNARHPEDVDAPLVFTGRDPETDKQLRDGTYVFQLGQGCAVRGIVVDPDGQPVSGAKVSVGNRLSSARRTATSSADGTFVVTGCPPGKTIVSAESAGFAVTTVEADISAITEPVRLKLQHGRVVSLRVVDTSGQSVTNAHVQLDWYPHLPTPGSTPKPPPVQTKFIAMTDAEGQVVWSNAPDVELSFLVDAPGHMHLNDVAVHPDEQAHVITLPPALVVTGTVRDAASGQLIPRFRIACGWPDSNRPNDPTSAHWSTIDRFRLNFANGEFHHSFEEPLVMHATNPSYILKFEADGYAPYTSRVIHPDEGEVQLDVQLVAATAITVTVLSPDGRAVAGADVGLISPGARLRLVPGGISHQNLQSVGALLTTDATGHFNLPGDIAITHVIVAGTDGYAEVTPSELASQPTIRLQPWGRIEGTYLVGGQPAAGRHVQFGYGHGDLNGVSSDFLSFRVKVDTDGRFVFPQVPPGQHRVSGLIPRPPPHDTEFTVPQPVDIEIRPGETTTVTLGSGYAVSAQLRWIDGVKPETGENILARVRTPFPPSFEKAAKDPAGSAKLQQSSEFREFAKTVQIVTAVVTGDGSVTAEGILAGDYVLEVFVMPKAVAGQRVVPLATGQVSFTVPANPANGSLDLGEIVVHKSDSPP